MSDEECLTLGVTIGGLTLRQQYKILEGVRAAHDEQRLNGSIEGTLITGGDRFLSMAIDRMAAVSHVTGSNLQQTAGDPTPQMT